jgi:hypothetical protein
MNQISRLATVGVTVFTAVGITAAVAMAADEPKAKASAAVIGTSLIGDMHYPNAEKLRAEQNVTLLSGDGGILIADCATPPSGDIGLIQVYTSDLTVNGGGRVCFKVRGGLGVLTMEVPDVFEIRGDGKRQGTGHDVTATVKPEDGEQQTIKVDPDGSTQVGIGTDPPGSATTLLKLEVNG